MKICRTLWPKPVTGISPLAAWLNTSRRAQQGSTLQPGPGYRLKETASGVRLEILPQAGGGRGSTPANEYYLESVQDDYLTVQAWDGHQTSGPVLYIAKPPKLRTSLITAIIYGVVHHYTYSAGPDQFNLLRTNTWPQGTETELVTPAWLMGDIIYAIPANTSIKDAGGNPISLLMVGEARQWASL
ncbi:MAG TPA: hypothetical protein VG167_18965 [Verrucomicrobiae bacterium]|nr:hypothetical protein [Verrucomicrobiae bacterium]